MPKEVKILVADDHEGVRRILCSLLSEHSGWETYEAENGKTALEQVKEIRPDVAVLDIVMPEICGIEAACQMRQRTPDTKVILISSHYTAEQAAMVGRLFSDGGFVQKGQAGTELVPAIEWLLQKLKTH
jgi:two-component system invasion response regulator UvrY